MSNEGSVQIDMSKLDPGTVFSIDGESIGISGSLYENIALDKELLGLIEHICGPLDGDVDLNRALDMARAQISMLKKENEDLRRALDVEKGVESAAPAGWHWNPHVRYWWSDSGWAIWRSERWQLWAGKIYRDLDFKVQQLNEPPSITHRHRAVNTDSTWDAMAHIDALSKAEEAT